MVIRRVRQGPRSIHTLESHTNLVDHGSELLVSTENNPREGPENETKL